MDFSELKNIDKKDLEKMLAEKKAELKNLRFSAHSGQLKQVHKIKNMKKDIARVMLKLSELKK